MNEENVGDALQAEIVRYADPANSETFLYAALADSAGLGADEIDKEAAGKTLFSRVWQQAGDRVCVNPMVAAYIRDPTTADATTILAQIVNLLIEVKGINIVIVACLAVRIGLRKLCAGRDQG